MDTRILFFLLTLTAFDAFSQEIRGMVVDDSNLQPLTGALVVSAADSTVTDRSGHFQLQVDSLPAILAVRFLGYSQMNVSVQNTSDPVRIRLTPSNIELNEVVVSSGSQADRIRNTVGSINLIGKEMLLRDDPFSFTTSINRIPGIYMHQATYNTNRITIRGIGSRSPYGTNKIKAYFEDIPLTDGSGNSTIEDIDQALINRVEIVKGPNSSLYGAGLAGVIRLHTYQPANNTTGVESSMTAGSYQTVRWMNRFSHSDDAKTINLIHSTTTSDGYRDNSDYRRDQVGLTGRFYLDDHSSISFLGVYTGLKAYIPSSLNEDDYRNDPRIAAFNWAQARGFEQYNKGIFGISGRFVLTPEWSLASSVFCNFRDAYEPRPFTDDGILFENTTSLGTRDLLIFQREKFSAIAGVELYLDHYEWSTFENRFGPGTNGSVLGAPHSIYQEDRNYFNFFAETTLHPFSKLTIVAGLNLNRTFYELHDLFTPDSTDQTGQYTFDAVLSPRVGASYAIHEFASAFVNFSHGFSPPGLDETLYPDGQINPKIQPEKGWNFETGLKGNLSRLNYDLAIYLMRIQDLIVAERYDETRYVGINAGLNTHLGADLYTNYSFPLSKRILINFFNSFSWMDYRFTEFIHEDMDYSGHQLTGVPQVMLSPGLELMNTNGFYGNLTGQYVGRIPVTDANDLYADAFFILRAKAGYRLLFSHWVIDFNAGANNLTDEKYASMLLINAQGFGANKPRYYYPGNPRNYFAGISIKFLIL